MRTIVLKEDLSNEANLYLHCTLYSVSGFPERYKQQCAFLLFFLMFVKGVLNRAHKQLANSLTSKLCLASRKPVDCLSDVFGTFCREKRAIISYHYYSYSHYAID